MKIEFNGWIFTAYLLAGAAVAVLENEPGVTLRGIIATVMIIIALMIMEEKSGE